MSKRENIIVSLEKDIENTVSSELIGNNLFNLVQGIFRYGYNPIADINDKIPEDLDGFINL